MSDFLSFARAHGLEIARLNTSGKIARCGTVEHPRSDNGAYVWDGARGWVMAWDGDGETHWFSDPHVREWTDAEKRQWAQRRQAQRNEIERSHRRATDEAQRLLQTCTTGPAKYLQYKGLGDTPALVLPDGALFVPMRSLAGDLHGAQVIRWNPDARKHEKKMLPGMKAKGAVHRLGARSAHTTILCEGYATGLSIKAAAQQMRLDATVLVCFSDSNMVFIAPAVTGNRIVFADNDASGAGIRAAQATGLRYCMAPTVGHDANDWHMADGVMALCRTLVRVLREEVAA